MLSWALMSNKPVGKCQTLTYTKFCRYAGLLGHSCPQYQAYSFPSVHGICTRQLELMLLCRAGPNSPTSFSECLPHMASLSQRKCATHGRGSNRSWQHLISFIYFHICIVQLYKEDCGNCQALYSRAIVPTVWC